jgi:mannosyltransferase
VAINPVILPGDGERNVSGTVVILLGQEAHAWPRSGRAWLAPASPAALAAVVGLTTLAAVLRFLGLGHQGFWFDEANTALLVKYSPGAMLGLIPHTESTPPLYYCVAWVWSRVFGDTETGLRSLSAVAGVLTVPVAYAAAVELTRSRRVGFVVGALATCNPLLVWYSQEARSYSLLVLLCALALWTFARALGRPEPWPLAAWVLACALALATHYYAVIAVAPQAVWLLICHRRRRAVVIAVGAVALCGLALIPLALSQNSTGHDSWIGHSSLRLRLAQVLPQFLIGTGAPARKALKWAAFMLAATGLGLLLISLREPEREARRVRGAALAAGGLALAGFVLGVAFVGAGSDALITRNLLPIWLPATILLAGGVAAPLSRPAGRAAGTLVTVGLCVIGVVAVIGVYSDYNLQRPDWRPVARMLGSSPAPGTDRVILIQHYRTLLPLSLMLPGLRFLRAPIAHRVTEFDVISMRSPQQPLCWWGAACNLIPSQMQARYGLPGFRAVWRRQVHQFTILRLVARRPLTLSRATVAGTLVTTTLRHDDLLFQRSAAG